ncbi:MAG: transketolase [Spirochaetales bacterium]|uniref:Transketolase n=1 Tax=Candidatus Thalassospirochaeta sargassi TaxID=3119039 RepID=A0AAJ1IF13_9SPIO|nr:transketolase [Spirochaetales bacterium]
MNTEKLDFLTEKAKEIRISTIEMIGNLGVGHIGGALSIVELLTALYNGIMDIDPEDPKKANRDKLVLSKGHAGPALYATLADRGFFDKSWLSTLNAGGTMLPSHCDMNRTPGIDMTTGSLGQGLSAAAGLCLSNRMSGIDKRVFAVIGDGESNEGQIWEAAMAASQFCLDKLTAFTDYNKMQIDGMTADVMDLGDIEGKWASFGWDVQRIDGHDIEAIFNTVEKADVETDKPSMIILDTVKGKGCFFAEGNLSNHNMAFNSTQAAEAIALLRKENKYGNA